MGLREARAGDEGLKGSRLLAAAPEAALGDIMSAEKETVVLVAAVRTPVGEWQIVQLFSVSPPLDCHAFIGAG